MYVFLYVFLFLSLNIAHAQEKDPSSYNLSEIESLLENFYDESVYENLIPYAKAGIRKLSKNNDSQDTIRARMLYFMAIGYFVQDDFLNAEKHLKEAIEIQKIKMPLSSKYAISLENLGEIYYSKENYAAAEPLWKELLPIKKKLYGENDLDYIKSLNNLALLYYNLKDFTSAEPLYKELLELQKKALGKNDAQYLLNLNILAYIYWTKSRYDLAQPLYQELVTAQKEILGETHLDYIESLHNLAAVYENLKNYTEAERLFTEIVKLKKEVLGDKHIDYALSLSNLANIYYQAGNYASAEVFYKEALKIQKEVSGKNSIDYVTALNELALVFSHIGYYALAESWFKEAVEIGKEILGDKHPDYAIILSNLAVVYMNIGNYTLSESLNKEALQIRKEALGIEHPDYAASLNNLAMVYANNGNSSIAIQLHKEALEIRKNVLGNKDPEYATSLNNLAIAYDNYGDYISAESLYEKALKIRKEILGAQHPDYAASLNNLALLYMNTGSYALAEPLFKEALEIRKTVLGEMHYEYAASLNNLACLYNYMGNYSLAEQLYTKAIQIQKEVLGAKHPNYAMSMNNLGMVYNENGIKNLAEPLLKEALQIRKEVLGIKHTDYAASLNNLGKFYFENGDNTQAEPLLKEALQIRKEVLGNQHPEYANSLNALAVLYEKNYALAEPLYKEAIQIQKEVLGENHLDYANSLNNLAILYTQAGHYSKAMSLYTEALSINKKNLSQNFEWLSEKRKNSYWQKSKNFYQGLNNFAALAADSLPNAAELSYQGNLIAKALLLESSRKMEEAIANSKDNISIQIYFELKKNREQFTYLISSGFDNKQILNNLEHQADSLDEILIKRMKEYTQAKYKFEITWKDVQKKLKEKEVAIEFARFYDETKGDNRYIAMVLRPSYKYPQVVKLCTQKEISEIPSGKGFASLYKLIWQPMDSLLIGVETIYYSPNGTLNNISFAALCDKGSETSIITKDTLRNGSTKSGTQTSSCNYMIDKYVLHQLTTTRSLVEGFKNIEIEPSILIFGGVDYETIPSQILALKSTPKDDGLLENISRNSSNASKMVYLPGTHTELLNLEKTLIDNNWSVRAYSAVDASENIFKKEVLKENPSVLHIATHGFAFPETESASLYAMDKKIYREADNPMVRSGLLLAGANHSWTGNANIMLIKTGEDGILTALEVSSLSLKNTKLVVLSACETGLGKIENTEGTFGLKRGFKLAGVEQIIVSLWSVPDKETMELMSLFYENLVKSKDIVFSFEKAQKAMRDKYADRPDLWAGFVLVR